MRLKRFLLRYYPPGVILEYEQGGSVKTKSIDLLDLKPDSDVDSVVDKVFAAEPLITKSRLPQVQQLIQSMQRFCN